MSEATSSLAQDRVLAITGSKQWPSNLDDELEAIAEAGQSRQATYERFRGVAVRMQDAISQNSACQGSGCSACCSISVVMSDVEAEILGGKLGKSPRRKVTEAKRENVADRWFGVPCTFLRKGTCSIYESRPIACVLNHSLGPDPSMCSTEVKPEDSCVPRMNLIGFWIQYIGSIKHKGWADIRSFFPTDLVATMPKRRG